MKLFLSYRRADTVHLAHHLRDQLASRGGIEAVFQDLDAIKPGEKYDDVIRATLADSDAVLVLIGDAWEGPPAGDVPARLFKDDDVARLEVRVALESEKRLIPILVDNRVMPQPQELPPDLHQLAVHNAVRLRSESLDRDIQALVDELKPPRPPIPWLRRLGQSLLGALVAAVVLLVVALVNDQWTGGKPLELTLQSQEAAIGVIVATLTVGILLPWWWPSRER